MKKNLLLLSISFAVFSCTGNTEKKYDAAGYDSTIVNAVTQMQQSLFAVQNTIDDSTAGDEVMKKYESIIDSVNNSVKKMPEYEGNATYRDAAAKLGDFYKKSVASYYSEVSHIMKAANDTTATNKVTDIINKLQTEEASADDDFQKERQAFIDKNGVKTDSIPG